MRSLPYSKMAGLLKENKQYFPVIWLTKAAVTQL